MEVHVATFYRDSLTFEQHVRKNEQSIRDLLRQNLADYEVETAEDTSIEDLIELMHEHLLLIVLYDTAEIL